MRRPSRGGGRVVLAIALSLTVAGCAAGAPAGTAGPATSDSAAPPAPPQPSESCGAPATPARTFWLPGPGGARLQGAVLGTGPDTAVFVHASGTQGLCGFWPFAEWLARAEGVRTVLFSQCGYGASRCPAADEGKAWLAATEAAVAWAREHGARRVTLVGASAGGVVVLHAAASIRPPIDAVVSLSAESRWSGLDSLAAVRRLEAPALFAVAPGDSYVTVGETRRLYGSAPVDAKRLIVLPDGAGHGSELLGSATAGWSPLAATIAAWTHGRHR